MSDFPWEYGYDVKEEIKKLQAEKENNMQLMQNSFGN